MGQVDLHLLPIPRHINIQEATFKIPLQSIIVASSSLLFEAQGIQKELKKIGVSWEIVAGHHYDSPALQLVIDQQIKHEQGYKLEITANGIIIKANDSAGIFYGINTLQQLVQQFKRNLPILTVEDWPDFAHRGIMLDISRDKVPTMQTLYSLIDELAAWKINQLQLYTEHTFAYQNHSEVWAQASPLTGQEILELDVYCKQRHIDLVPNQNSLGHMERWLKFDRYLPLAECPEGFVPPWGGDHRPASTLNPQDPGSIELISNLYDELLPHFGSQLFNVGGDEPWELGQGKSKQAVEEQGGRVYLEYMKKLYELVTRHERKMQFWGDIILHSPQLVSELPKDIIVMEWGYEADHDFDGHCAVFAESNIPFYVCPGTSSWNTIGGRTENAIGNLQSAAKNGLKHGAIGYLNTDWGDSGHWQSLPISYLGFAYGAAVSWAYEANKDLDIPEMLNRIVFKDDSKLIGQLAYDLGNIYRLFGPPYFNGHILARVLQMRHEQLQDSLASAKNLPDVSIKTLQESITQIDAIIKQLDEVQIQRPDANLIRDEFRQAANLMKHGAKRLLYYQGDTSHSAKQLTTELEMLISKQREIWLARNRRGGLEDSIARFEATKQGYARL